MKPKARKPANKVYKPSEAQVQAWMRKTEREHAIWKYASSQMLEQRRIKKPATPARPALARLLKSARDVALAADAARRLVTYAQQSHFTHVPEFDYWAKWARHYAYQWDAHKSGPRTWTARPPREVINNLIQSTYAPKLAKATGWSVEKAVYELARFVDSL